MLWEYPWFPEPETFQLMGGASHHFSLPWLPSLCIISNNKPAQSEAIIESLLSADINGIPSSELLCGCLIGRHVEEASLPLQSCWVCPLVSGPPQDGLWVSLWIWVALDTIAERSRKTKDQAGQPGGLETEGTLAEKRNDPADEYCCPNF